MSRLPSGLHLLGAPTDAELMAKIGPESYGHLLAFLSIFYEVILLDLGTGITDPLARFAIERSDQLVLVTTPEFITSQSVAGALRYLAHERATLVLNQASSGHEADIKQIEAHFREQRLRRSVTIPRDDQLRTMLDTGTYGLDALERDTRRADQAAGAGRGGAARLMSALRERPRVVVAQLVGIVALLAIGFVIGGAVKSDPDPYDDPGVQQRIERLERSNARLERQLRDQTRQADAAQAATRRQARGYNRRLRRSVARNRRLIAALRRARAN